MKPLLILFTFFTLSSFHFNKDVEIILLQNHNDDVTLIKCVYASLMAAETVAKVLNVDVVVSETNSDVIIFSVNSDEQRELAIKIFDEEGFETHANTTTVLQTGRNYRALNVKTIEDGEYIFELSNGDGDVIRKSITIQND